MSDAETLPLFGYARPRLYDWLAEQETEEAHEAQVQVDMGLERGLSLRDAIIAAVRPLAHIFIQQKKLWVARVSYPSHPRRMAHLVRPGEELNVYACGLRPWWSGDDGEIYDALEKGDWAFVDPVGPLDAMAVVSAFGESKLKVCKTCLKAKV